MSYDGESPIPDFEPAIDVPENPLDVPEATDTPDGDLGDASMQPPYRYGKTWY